MYLDPSLSLDELLITTCPADGSTAATGFADPQAVVESCDSFAIMAVSEYTTAFNNLASQKGREACILAFLTSQCEIIAEDWNNAIDEIDTAIEELDIDLDASSLCEMRELVFLIPDYQATAPLCDLDTLTIEFESSVPIVEQSLTQNDFEREPMDRNVLTDQCPTNDDLNSAAEDLDEKIEDYEN